MIKSFVKSKGILHLDYVCVHVCVCVHVSVHLCVCVYRCDSFDPIIDVGSFPSLNPFVA
jgi:hypothetical protein